jgi:hypothetical protein
MRGANRIVEMETKINLCRASTLRCSRLSPYCNYARPTSSRESGTSSRRDPQGEAGRLLLIVQFEGTAGL